MSVPTKPLIVIPALNEEETVASVVKSVKRAIMTADVLVVNDGSTDNTFEVAEEAGATVLDLPFNLGVGGAMRTGFRYATKNGFDAVVQVDADGQHSPAEITNLLAKLSEFDVAIGARFAGKGEYSAGALRRFAMKVLAIVLSKVAGTNLTDTTSGFRASGPKAVKLFAETYPSEYLGDTIESLVIASRAGLTITQVPVEMHPRAGGVPSHNPAKAALFLMRAVIALGFALIKPRARPGAH